MLTDNLLYFAGCYSLDGNSTIAELLENVNREAEVLRVGSIALERRRQFAWDVYNVLDGRQPGEVTIDELACVTAS